VELEIVSPFKGATREVPVAEWNQQNRRRTLRHFVAYILIGASAVILEEFLKMSTWANKPDENWVGLGEEALMALMGVPIAGLILLIVLKSIGRKVRLADTLLAMAVVMWLAPLLRVLGWVTHYVASGSVGDVIQLLATAGGTVFVLVYLASLRRDPKSRAFQYTVAAVAILIFIGSKGLKKYSSNDDNSQNTDFYLRPPIMEFVGPTHSLEEFMRESRERSKEVFSTLKE
jgi:FtsH-binding integral membrane protein